MDINSICRLCAETNCTLHSLFNGNHEEEAVKQIQALATVEISLDDGLPKMICATCTDKLNAVSTFRDQILSTDEKLRLHVSTPQLPSKKTDNWDSEPENDNDILLPKCEIKTNFDSDSENNEEIHSKLDIKTETNSEDSNSDWLHSSNEVSNDEEEPEENEINEQEKKKFHKELFKKKDQRSDPAFSMMCAVCGKLLKKNSFADHMVNVHSQEAKYECNVCGKKIKTKRQLWHHNKSHTKESMSCDQCGKIFTSKSGFKRHYDDVHLGIRRHNCNLCNKTFPRTMALKRHMRTHTGERPYVCSYCDRGFAGRWNLKQHIRLHTKEKPYKCKLCLEAFTQNVMLKLHIKNKHSEASDDMKT